MNAAGTADAAVGQHLNRISFPQRKGATHTNMTCGHRILPRD